ncbi:MAG: dihydropteroate synthase [Alistipes onderdonkii]
MERFGPLIINDISAGELDPAMPAVAAKYGALHRHAHEGDPKTMQSLTDYKRDITAEVVAYFEARVAALLAAGSHASISSRPGFSFAKTTEQNYELLAGLHRLCALGYPVLAGLSRKSMIYRVLGATLPNPSRVP